MDFFSKEYFETRSVKVPWSGCWIWTNHVDRHGYGRFKTQAHGKTFFAHRMSFLAHGGVLQSGQCVLHHCDTPGCVNPGHLYAGSYKDNVRDMIERGRHDHSGLELGREKSTHCPYGHGELASRKSANMDYKYCMVCHRERQARYRKEKQSSPAPL